MRDGEKEEDMRVQAGRRDSRQQCTILGILYYNITIPQDIHERSRNFSLGLLLENSIKGTLTSLSLVASGGPGVRFIS
jgi:hypothetical protein